VERFVHLREEVGQIQRLAQAEADNDAMKEIGKISTRILEEL
jgi:hypothetical protein